MAVDNRWYFLDNVKFILIILVVFGHMYTPYIGLSPITSSLYLFIYVFHMPLFVLISGFFSKNFAHSSRFRIEKVIFYLVLYILMKYMNYIWEAYVFRHEGASINLFYTTSAAWYLFAMAFWMTLLYLLRDIKPRVVLIVSIIIALLAGFYDAIDSTFVASRILVFFPFFYLGYMLRRNHIEGLLKRRWLRLLSIVVLFCMLIGSFFAYTTFWDYHSILMARLPYQHLPQPQLGAALRLLWYVIASLCSLAVLSFIPRNKTRFSVFGGRTLQVFFFHVLIAYPIRWTGIYEGLMHRFPHTWAFLYGGFTLLIVLMLSMKPLQQPFLALQKGIDCWVTCLHQ